MPNWSYRRPVVGGVKPTPVGGREFGAPKSGAHAHPPAASHGANGSVTRAPHAPKVAAAQPKKLEASTKVVTSKEDLPPYVKVYGVDSNSLNEAMRSGVAGLIHADSSATVLIAPDFKHLLDAFVALLSKEGHRTNEIIPASSDFIFALYQKGTLAAERRQRYQDNANPAEGQKVLHGICERAMEMGASDVHIHVLLEARPPVSKVFFRVHGAFLPQPDLLTDPHTANSICRAAYTGESVDTASRSSTGFKTNTGMYATLQIEAVKNMRLRLQTMPHVLGYGMNLRILSYDGLTARYKDLCSMGFSLEQQREIVDAFGTERGGLILFIAGTGEGKTTTVMTAIPMERKFDERNWISIEDPVEIINPKIFQSPVKRETGDTHDNKEHVAAMANSLRFDPDGISAGELRDAITTSMAESAAMTGHVTVGTLHGNDAFGAFNRLIDLGARKINLLDGVARLFCHQKLVQTLCPHCSTLAVNSTDRTTQLFLKELVRTYEVDASKVRLRGCGCDKCYPPGSKLAGVSGRTVVAEVVRFTRPIVDALRASEDTEPARRVWRSQRVAEYHEEGTLGKTLGEHALYKLLKGEIDPETYIGVADDFDTHSPMPITRNRGGVCA